MAVSRLLTKSKFAELAGVSPPAVTKMIRKGGLLERAVVGKYLDLDHEDVVVYLGKREKKQERQAKAPPKVASGETSKTEIGILTQQPKGGGVVKARKKQEADEEPLDEVAFVDVSVYADMTLREIVKKHGTDVRFVDFLAAFKKLQEITQAELKIAEAKGELVSRELVKRGVIDPIYETMAKLLTDAPRTITVRASAMIEGKQSDDEIRGVIVDILQSFVKPMKAKMERAIAG